MTIFIVRDTKHIEDRAHVVEAPAHFDVVKVMSARLGIAPAQVDAFPVATARANVQLEWRGHDAGATQGRFLWSRERPIDDPDAPWSEWSKT